MTERALTFQQLQEKIGFTRSWIYRLERQGKFPRRRKVGAKAVRWMESEVNQWLANQEQVID